jgi:glycosyltransferase involved in cell wall biosynthesis
MEFSFARHRRTVLPDDPAVTPFVSVIIPTYNRSGLLAETVESFLHQTYPANRFEIIVVDNDSSDDTPAVIEELVAKSSRVRGVVEMRKGAHFARNTGGRAAKGAILYFTDDDMLADERLLEKIVEPFSIGANVGSASGRIIPAWQTEPPVWILEYCRNELLSLNDLGVATIISDTDPGVFSCHQAVLREAFFLAGGFNPDTNAGELVGDNETGLNIKIRDLGYKFAYVGESVIRHVIPESRMSQRYLNSRFADQGYCDSYTTYRRRIPGAARLTLAMLRNAAMVVPNSIVAAFRAATGNSAWRLNFARLFYLRNRVVYDFRLFRSERWRRFALRNDWLTDD